MWILSRRFGTTASAIASINQGIDLNNLYVGQTICIPQEIGFYTTLPQSVSMEDYGMEEELKEFIRMLWEQHSTLTTLAIKSILFGLPDEAAVTKRLLRNPKDFGLLLSPLYGEEKAAELAKLLNDHLMIASQLTKAAMAGNSNTAAELEKQWYRNADQIAAFFASVNPYWDERAWKEMLYDHLKFVKSEAESILMGKYDESTQIYDEKEKQALDMADEMSRGIIRQFSS